MGIIRIEKTKNYTVMSNYHFKEKGMSWKAKGIMSVMLSLPDGWDFSVKGLCALSSDGETSTRSALKELEEFGYLKRERVYVNGKIADINYTLYEVPQENLKQGNLSQENLIQEKQAQLNTINNKILKELNTKKIEPKKVTSREQYLERCEKIINEFDFSDDIIDKILEYLENRSILTDNQLRVQLTILAELSYSEQFNSLKMAIGAGWKMMAYPKNKNNNRRAKDDIGLSEKEEKEMYRQQELERQQIENEGGIVQYATNRNIPKF